jgi:hypothetical protein
MSRFLKAYDTTHFSDNIKIKENTHLFKQLMITKHFSQTRHLQLITRKSREVSGVKANGLNPIKFKLLVKSQMKIFYRQLDFRVIR